MSTTSSAIDTLVRSDLWREFEKTARSKHRRPVELLADVIADFLETQEGIAILDDVERNIRRKGYTEDDAVEIVRAYRSSRRQ
jgi:hypothetical protein